MTAPERAADHAGVARAVAASALAAAAAAAGLAAAGFARYLELALGGPHSGAQAFMLGAVLAGAALGCWQAARMRIALSHPWVSASSACAITALGLVYFNEAALALADALAAGRAGTAARSAAFAALALPFALLASFVCSLLIAQAAGSDDDGGGSSDVHSAKAFAVLGAGAAAGIAAGIVLVWTLGLPAATLAAAVLFAAAGLGSWIAQHRMPAHAVQQPAAPVSLAARMLLLAPAAAGFALAASCVLWMRAFGSAFGPIWPTAAFAPAAALAGVALGALLAQRMRADPAVIAGRALLLMGLYLLAAFAWLEPATATFAETRISSGAFYKQEVGLRLRAVVAGGFEVLLFLLPAACAGACTAATARAGSGGFPAGASFSCALLGAAAGLALGALALLPLAGLWAGQAYAALPALGGGLALIAARERKRLAPAAALAIAAAAAAVLHAPHQPQASADAQFSERTAAQIEEEQEDADAVEYYAEGFISSVAVTSSAERRSLSVDGVLAGSVREYFTQEFDGNIHQSEVADVLAGLIPQLHVPQASTAAVAGLGTGMVQTALLHGSSLEAVHAIEPERRVLEAAASMGPLVTRALHDPRSRISIGQPAAFFDMASPGSYDIIVVNYDRPWVAAHAPHYDPASFARMKRALAPAGVLLMRLDLRSAGPLAAAMAMNALGASFAGYEAYSVGNSLLVAAGDRLLEIDPSLLASDAQLTQVAARVGLARPADIHELRIGSSDLFAPLFASYLPPENSALFPVLESQAAGDAARSEWLAMRELRRDYSWVLSSGILPGSAPLPEADPEAERGLGRRFLALQALRADSAEHLAGVLEHIARSAGARALEPLLRECAADDRSALASFTRALQQRVARVEPYLLPAESRTLRELLAAHLPCYAVAAADPALAPLYEFWSAYAAADYEKAYRIGRGMVQHSLAVSYGEQLLLLKTMLAAYAIGEDLQVPVLSRRMAPDLPAGMQLAARLLAAHALARFGAQEEAG